MNARNSDVWAVQGHRPAGGTWRGLRPHSVNFHFAIFNFQFAITCQTNEVAIGRKVLQIENCGHLNSRARRAHLAKKEAGALPQLKIRVVAYSRLSLRERCAAFAERKATMGDRKIKL
jgi:hypothetical protein